MEILAVILVILVVFLVFREVNCWYWKINKGLAVLEDIRDLLKQEGKADVE
jgi:hypothetical protein